MNTGDSYVFNLREQVVQAVTGFVEQCDDVIVRECGGLVTDRRREVAVEVGDWRLDAVGDATAGEGFVHPGTAAFLIAGIEIQIELTDQLVATSNAEETDAGVPDRCRVRCDLHAEQTLDDTEQTAEYVGF